MREVRKKGRWRGEGGRREKGEGERVRSIVCFESVRYSKSNAKEKRRGLGNGRAWKTTGCSGTDLLHPTSWES